MAGVSDSIGPVKPSSTPKRTGFGVAAAAAAGAGVWAWAAKPKLAAKAAMAKIFYKQNSL
jgi:hypothetical protein